MLNYAPHRRRRVHLHVGLGPVAGALPLVPAREFCLLGASGSGLLEFSCYYNTYFPLISPLGACTGSSPLFLSFLPSVPRCLLPRARSPFAFLPSFFLVSRFTYVFIRFYTFFNSPFLPGSLLFCSFIQECFVLLLQHSPFIGGVTIPLGLPTYVVSHPNSSMLVDTTTDLPPLVNLGRGSVSL